MDKIKERNSFVELLRSFWTAELDEEEENKQVLENVSAEEKEEYKKAWNNIEKMIKQSEKKLNKQRKELNVVTKPMKVNAKVKEQPVVEKEEEREI